MPNASRIQLKGFDQLARKMKQLPSQVEKEVDAEIKFAGREWESGAKRDAPKDQGRLVNEIRAVHKGKMHTEIVANNEYAHIMEWGSKSRVSVPPELAGYASLFRGYPKGKNPKKFIYEWCRRVGIPPERWWHVYRSIMRYGVRPKPFFFKQRSRVEPNLIKRLQTIINTPA